MLTAVVLVAFLAWVTLVAALLARLADWLEGHRIRRVAAQVQLTDAVHGALGAIVAPTVATRRGRRWTVTMGLAPGQLGAAGRLTEIAWQVLGQASPSVRIVFVPRKGR